ncbi:glycosyltransferase family 4 protein [Desulfobacula phenolica]|uniref:Glycosyltransferase involved in cell wall bisynthesis n=1 Tax=Desulfobacula phenolica TaxID=90732 RepID=A0A1H2ENZ2_9BACT|nr:glycosyltransferase family 4 protein [Desulfobacula phenolica]SDT96836.1 Glycosyltransferase involved in cell wall bisynthesis [Desulfobacula phenolica]
MKVANNNKILMLLSNAFDPDPRVHREATALVTAGYDVTVLCWDRDFKSPAGETIDGVRIERIYVKSTHGRGVTQIGFLLVFWIKAFLCGIRKKINYVHAHDFDTLPLGYILAKFKSVNLIYDSHESYVDMLYHHPVWLKNIIFKVENHLLNKVDLVITVGEKLRQYLETRGAKKTCVVGNWQDPEKFKFSTAQKEQAYKTLGIKENQKVIAFIANLGLERQVPQLIEAVRQMPDMFLVLGGDGPCRALAEKAASECKNIVYLGYVKPDKVPFYTALSDIIFYGFDPKNPNAEFSAPNKLFEGLAAGKIIVTGDFGEIGKIVRKKKCGIMVDGYSTSVLIDAFKKISQHNAHDYCRNSLNACKNEFNLRNASEILKENYKNFQIHQGAS